MMLKAPFDLTDVQPELVKRIAHEAETHLADYLPTTDGITVTHHRSTDKVHIDCLSLSIQISMIRNVNPDILRKLGETLTAAAKGA
jgi:hypothetical protein